MNIEQIENTLLTIITGFDGEIPSERLQDMCELTKAGEPGVAFENLCTNLDDYGVTIAPNVLSLIQNLGQTMEIAPRYWERLAIKKPQ